MTLREHMKKYHPEKAHYQMLPCNCADYQHMLNRYCERTDCENCWNQEYIPKKGETMETKKYIIEIPEDTAYLKILRVEGPGDIVYVKDLEEYSPLKEKLAVEARQSGYDAGYDDGRKDGYWDGRKRGQEDAWEFARFLWEDKTEGGMDYDDFVATYGPDAIPEEVFANMSYADAVAKYEEHMEYKKKEFKVGDEVQYGVNIGVILGIINNYLTVYSRYYSDPFRTWKKENVVKTGRHYDSVAAVLEEIG